MQDLITLITYPINKIVILLGSLQFDGISLASIIIAGSLLSIIFRFFVGQHSFVGGLKHGNSSGKSGGSDDRSNSK